MHFISPELEGYIEEHSEKEPTHLAALNKETYQKIEGQIKEIKKF